MLKSDQVAVDGERIVRLSADFRKTLTIGSVIGEEFAVQVVGSIQGVDERALVRSLSRERFAALSVVSV